MNITFLKVLFLISLSCSAFGHTLEEAQNSCNQGSNSPGFYYVDGNSSESNPSGSALSPYSNFNQLSNRLRTMSLSDIVVCIRGTISSSFNMPYNDNIQNITITGYSEGATINPAQDTYSSFNFSTNHPALDSVKIGNLNLRVMRGADNFQARVDDNYRAIQVYPELGNNYIENLEVKNINSEFLQYYSIADIAKSVLIDQSSVKVENIKIRVHNHSEDSTFTSIFKATGFDQINISHTDIRLPRYNYNLSIKDLYGYYLTDFVEVNVNESKIKGNNALTGYYLKTNENSEYFNLDKARIWGGVRTAIFASNGSVFGGGNSNPNFYIKVKRAEIKGIYREGILASNVHFLKLQKIRMKAHDQSNFSRGVVQSIGSRSELITNAATLVKNSIFKNFNSALDLLMIDGDIDDIFYVDLTHNTFGNNETAISKIADEQRMFMKVQNTIFEGANGQVAFENKGFSPSGTGTIEIDSNIFSPSITPFVDRQTLFNLGDPLSTLTENGTSFIADPMIRNTKFYGKLEQGSPAINAASTNSILLLDDEIRRDFYNRERDSQPDIGAVEYMY